MAGFFDFVGRVVQGQPLFDEQSSQPGQTPPKSEAPPTHSSPLQKSNPATFPVVFIKQLNPKADGSRLNVYAHIASQWSEEIFIDKIRALGITRELDAHLNPHEEKEFLIYSGPKLTKAFPDARLDYKTRNEGDFFESVHELRFTFHPEDKTYLPAAARLHLPIRDIYG